MVRLVGGDLDTQLPIPSQTGSVIFPSLTMSSYALGVTLDVCGAGWVDSSHLASPP